MKDDGYNIDRLHFGKAHLTFECILKYGHTICLNQIHLEPVLQLIHELFIFHFKMKYTSIWDIRTML